ncbi:MAG: hypothetical protein V4519_04685 [Patescibacteria group bacterium]
MLTESQVEEIKELEREFLEKIEGLKNEYREELKKAMAKLEQSKVDQLRKELSQI